VFAERTEVLLDFITGGDVFAEWKEEKAPQDCDSQEKETTES